ncbi:MAG: aldo/keto reductase [Candidatus Endonucleobacter sp. (ex Gigantidas childressi)]|nr:aldo/keto reductase [Candidatus Endonucleobacter sp. (ex Gigantidas childressi)]
MEAELGKKIIAGTNIAVSSLGLGTVKLGRNQQVKYPVDFEIPNDKKVKNLLDLAQELGINLLDTAPSYGSSEERLGQLLGHRRKDWVICGKVGEEFESGESRFDFSPKHIRFSVERTLKRLNSDYIDIVLIHSSGDDINIIQQFGCLDILSDLKKEGLIRFSGMSTKTIEGGLMALKQSDMVMVTYNLRDQSAKPVLDYAKEHNKGILIKKAFASGYACLDGEDQVLASMKLLTSHPAISSTVVGTINSVHLRQNVAAYKRASS